MNYSDKHKAVFLLPPRQGTRSIANLLKYLDFKSDSPTPEREVHTIDIPEGKEDYTLCCTIRNPYKRYLSSKNLVWEWSENNHPDYQGKDVTTLSEDDWIERSFGWISDYDEILKIDSKYGVDYFVDTSNLGNDLKQIPFIKSNLLDSKFASIWNQNINNNRFNLAAKAGVKFTLSQKEIDFIYTQYQEVFNRFGYKKDSWKYLV